MTEITLFKYTTISGKPDDIVFKYLTLRIFVVCKEEKTLIRLL